MYLSSYYKRTEFSTVKRTNDSYELEKLEKGIVIELKWSLRVVIISPKVISNYWLQAFANTYFCNLCTPLTYV
jgi:hypothetical protein